MGIWTRGFFLDLQIPQVEVEGEAPAEQAPVSSVTLPGKPQGHTVDR